MKHTVSGKLGIATPEQNLLKRLIAASPASSGSVLHLEVSQIQISVPLFTAAQTVLDIIVSVREFHFVKPPDLIEFATCDCGTRKSVRQYLAHDAAIGRLFGFLHE